MKVSVVINTLNEERNIPLTIKSVKDFADEIVVVDMYSDDMTVEIAQRLGAKVYMHERADYVEPARNFAISKATGDWVLILDADERMSSKLEAKLKKIVKENMYDYIRIPRKNIVFGRWLKHSRWWPDYNIRFFKKGKVSWNEVIHSVPTARGTGIDLLPKEKYALVHHHYKNIDQYLERMARYTRVQAELKSKDNYKFVWQDIILKPVNEFLSRYFSGKGYKDGIHGLVLSILQAFSEFILYLRLWQKEKFIDENVSLKEVVEGIKETQKRINYWKADALYREKGGVIQRIKRKFKLL